MKIYVVVEESPYDREVCSLHETEKGAILKCEQLKARAKEIGDDSVSYYFYPFEVQE
jgi:hypothetical protein